jgi:hypothetical protein
MRFQSSRKSGNSIQEMGASAPAEGSAAACSSAWRHEASLREDGERGNEGARRDREREGDLRVAGNPGGVADYCLTSFLSTILILSPIL